MKRIAIMFALFAAVVALCRMAARTRGDRWYYGHIGSLYDVYGAYSIIPCTNLWDISQRTNCRVREWSFGINDRKPFFYWEVWTMDVNANWHKLPGGINANGLVYKGDILGGASDNGIASVQTLNPIHKENP